MAALDGRGNLLFVVGEAGLGKSRLAREVAAQARGRGARVIVGRAVPAGSSTPFRPLTEALGQLLRDSDVLSDPEFAPWLPALGAVLRPPYTGRCRPAAESPLVVADAVLRLLRTFGAAAGLVVILEDLHW